MKSTACARAIASSLRTRLKSSTECSTFPFLRRPAVSTSTYRRPSCSMSTSTASRVVPGFSLTITRSSPASALM